MKKTLTYLICTLMLLLALSACGKNGGTVSPSPTSTPVVTATPSAAPSIMPSESIMPDTSASPNAGVSPSPSSAHNTNS